MATKKTTTGSKSTTAAGKTATGKTATGKTPARAATPSAARAAAPAATRAATPKRAKLAERPKLKVGSRPVSAVPRKAKAVASAPEVHEAPPAAVVAPARSGTIPPPKGAVPARARAGKATKKVASTDDSGRRTALAIAVAAVDKKALNVEVIDVRGKVDYADYVVLMSGRSDRQVSALARSIEEELLRKEKLRCAGVEGLGQGAWVLMDFSDVIVHIFHEDMRGYYDLESLWSDAVRVEVPQ